MRWLQVAALGFVAVTLAAYVYAQREQLQAFQWQPNWVWLVVAFVIFSLNMLLLVWLWARLMAHFGVSLPYHLHVTYYARSYLARRLPGSVWYVAGRVQLYGQHGIDPKLTATCSGIEYLILLVDSAIIAAVYVVASISALRNSPEVETFTYISLIAAPVLLVALALLPMMLARLRKRWGLVEGNTLTLGTFALYGLAYLLVYVNGTLFIYAIIRIMHPLAISQFPHLYGAWGASSLIASLALFLPTSFGLKEISMGVLLLPIVPQAIAVFAVIMVRIGATIFEILWSAVVVGILNLLPKRSKNET